MPRPRKLPAVPALRVLAACLVWLAANGCSHHPEIATAPAGLRDIEVVISTNGIIEPADNTGIYAPVDGFVRAIRCAEGSEVVPGQALIQLEASQARLSLAEARASLLEARRQARVVVGGPSKQELDPLEASISENALRLEQLRKDLESEERLYRKGAAAKESVERLEKERRLLELRSEALKQEKKNLLARYSEEEIAWEQEKVAALAHQVQLLERQVQTESVAAPVAGTLYSLSVKSGEFVGRGQLLGQIYRSGYVRLRAYVDEPDLGRIRRGQPVAIEWDGMRGRKWTGAVESPADQVVEMNNRSVGYVRCSIDGRPKELIPNTNVKIKITTDRKSKALLVPRSALFNHGGKPAVRTLKNSIVEIRAVEPGLVNSDEVEILSGIAEGDPVVLHPEEIQADQ